MEILSSKGWTVYSSELYNGASRSDAVKFAMCFMRAQNSKWHYTRIDFRSEEFLKNLMIIQGPIGIYDNVMGGKWT